MKTCGIAIIFGGALITMSGCGEASSRTSRLLPDDPNFPVMMPPDCAVLPPDCVMVTVGLSRHGDNVTTPPTTLWTFHQVVLTRKQMGDFTIDTRQALPVLNDAGSDGGVLVHAGLTPTDAAPDTLRLHYELVWGRFVQRARTALNGDKSAEKHLEIERFSVAEDGTHTVTWGRWWYLGGTAPAPAESAPRVRVYLRVDGSLQQEATP